MRALALTPPAHALSPELEWLLLRAFSEPRHEAPQVDGARVVTLARKLGLASRIGGRIAKSTLHAELGAQWSELAHEQLNAAAADAMLLAALRSVQRPARAVGAPLIALKFAALRSRGLVRAGQRQAHDIDVLTSRALAGKLRAALLADGCSESGVRGYAHQLAPVMSAEGVPIEIHLHVPGLRLPGSRSFAGAEELLAAGLTESRFELCVPRPEILTAHALAHGLLQNAGAPSSHSLLCTLADLSDIGASHPDALEMSVGFLAPLFDADDARCTAELLRELERGDVQGAMLGAGGALLRHALAARLDGSYASALRLRLITHPLSDVPFPLALARALSAALLPTDRELAIIYGAGMSRPALLARRLLRPVDLGLRLIAAGAARLSARL